MAKTFIRVTRPIYLGWTAIIVSRNVGFSNGVLCRVIDDLNTKSNKRYLYVYNDEYDFITDGKEINRIIKIMVFR